MDLEYPDAFVGDQHADNAITRYRAAVLKRLRSLGLISSSSSSFEPLVTAALEAEASTPEETLTVPVPSASLPSNVASCRVAGNRRRRSMSVGGRTAWLGVEAEEESLGQAHWYQPGLSR